ncbi:MAG: hypothetical protein QNI86_11840 [Halieaceae bacterium]|nr:hypothetical protein [Halieaceae bacterium]
MRSAFSRLLLALLLALMPTAPTLGVDYISIKFAKKNQLRTSFRWIQHNPRLVNNKSMTPVAVEGESAASAGRQGTSRPDKVGIPEEFYDLHLPYGAVGKIFFVKRSGEVSTCTGAFAGGGHTVLTAAHCVLGIAGDWHSDFIFVLAYGTENQEVYGIECAAVPGEWGMLEGNAALDYDYAFLRTTRASTQGSLGITHGIPPAELMLVGYSNNFKNGHSPLRVSVETFADGPARLAYANNPLSQGSSGTPWVGMSTVYSLTSHFHESEKDVMLGPRFTEKTMELLNYSRNGCEAG